MDFSRRELVHAGWSGDEKYRAWDSQGNSYFLRVCPLEKEEKLQKAFALQKQAADQGLPVSRPLELKLQDGKFLWVEEWLSGEMAEQVLPRLSQEEQYQMGVQAGNIAKALHGLPGPPPQESWEAHFNRKIDRKIQMYQECPLHYDNGELFVNYLQDHRDLLKDRPQCVQHGDFHVGNMMIQGNTLFVIDFDRPDYGDPWEEFNRIVWCAQLSPAFSSGLVDSYFHGTPPLLFWKLLALYIANNTLGSLPWAIPFGEKEITTMRNQAAEILKWYDGMRNPIPTWYQSQ
ncbi:MAG: phosphotransferase family protein [Acutalibacter sp.]|jgi:aminoglycoside phosphotransferase (APT) family kinase protein